MFLININIFYPFFEIFLEIFNNKIFSNFLKIISNLLNYSNFNISYFIENKFFEVFSLFLERYDKKYFNEEIINYFFNIFDYIHKTKKILYLIKEYFLNLILIYKKIFGKNFMKHIKIILILKVKIKILFIIF